MLNCPLAQQRQPCLQRVPDHAADARGPPGIYAAPVFCAQPLQQRQGHAQLKRTRGAKDRTGWDPETHTAVGHGIDVAADAPRYDPVRNVAEEMIVFLPIYHIDIIIPEIVRMSIGLGIDKLTELCYNIQVLTGPCLRCASNKKPR